VPLLALIAIFIVVPLAELYVILTVSDSIGWGPTLLILVADSLLGTWLLRTQGRTVWRRFNETLRAGRVPTREIVDGVMIIFGGAFLITPGFLTDIIGVLLLLPPTRALFRGTLERRLTRRVVVGRGGRGGSGVGGYSYDVDGTATEHREPSPLDAPELPPPPARSRRPRT
jgi:UPF0716 protein FxsA